MTLPRLDIKVLRVLVDTRHKPSPVLAPSQVPAALLFIGVRSRRKSQSGRLSLNETSGRGEAELGRVDSAQEAMSDDAAAGPAAVPLSDLYANSLRV